MFSRTGPIRFLAFGHIALAGALLLQMGCSSTGSSNSTTTQPPPSNPVPSLASITPTAVSAGSPATTLNITGSGFAKTSTVNFDGKNLTSSFISSTQLTAAIPASSETTSGNHMIAVSNPAPEVAPQSAHIYCLSFFADRAIDNAKQQRNRGFDK